MSGTEHHKVAARRAAKRRRAALANPEAGRGLIAHFPSETTDAVIAGFAPIRSEIDIWPLLHHLHGRGRQIVLPVTPGPNAPLTFRPWLPSCEMATDQYGVSYPAKGPSITPEFILIPLLAFTASGNRLGYGGGFYDRTLATLRTQGDVFACGVAYAGQGVESLPTDSHDERLDGILTEDGFRRVL